MLTKGRLRYVLAKASFSACINMNYSMTP
jgi:hypothetical protein